MKNVGMLYDKHLLLCNRNLHAALLLNHFYSFSYYAYCNSLGINDDYHDPAIYNSLVGISEWFMDAIEQNDMEKAFDLLVAREYVAYHYVDDHTNLPRHERVMSITCDFQKVDADCGTIKSPSILTHAKQHTEAETRRREEEEKYWHAMGPEDIKKSEEKDLMKQEEMRIRYHNSRAKSANLPATLMLDEWLETLNHFGWMCAYCQTRKYTLLEHFIPLGHGKGTTTDNCVPACHSCNNIKQAWNPLASYGPDMERMKEGINRVKTYLATKAQQS